MVKRILVVAIVVAAILVVAAPAMAFNGYRADYTTSDFCSICHKIGQPGNGPKVFDAWSETKHADAGADGQATRTPYGSSCAGCHTSNFSPSKVIPTPTATSTSGAVSWGAENGIPTEPQASGAAASSENFVGCSSCHYGAVTGDAPQYGNDANDTAHMAPAGNLADADICGQCHSRYSYTVATYPVTPLPYVKVTGTPAAPVPNPSPTSLLQPQYAIGYKMLGEPSAWTPAGLGSNLNTPFQGWVPTPDPSATTAAGLMTYWKNAGDSSDTLWQAVGHDGSAAQYPEWKNERHAQALDALQPLAAFMDVTSCLECHSADYRILKDQGYSPTIANVKYGVTCVGCHKPHDKGTAVGTWDTAFDAQLTTDDAKTLCVECHNGEIPAGTTASPGAEVHHPMKEMMDGYGAIDVAAFPSVHKGKCVQCHMPPTSYSRGAVQLGGNHTFNIITPGQATSVLPTPITTATAKATATPVPSGTPVVTTTLTVTQDTMPYSACSTCHDNNVKSTPQPVSSVTTTPSPSASPIQVTVTVTQNAAGGDKGLWLQDTIDQRQTWTKAKIVDIHAALDAAAVRLGYLNEADAHTNLVAIPAAGRTASETNFLKAFTNVGYVESEGSFGLHNWDYSRAIVNTALVEANSVEATPVPTPWTVSFKASKKSVYRNTTIKYSGTVAPAASLAWGGAKVTIQRKVSGVWKTWKSATCNGSGSYSLSVKMTSRGTYYLRAHMPANSKQLVGNSAQIKVVVK